MMDRKYLAGLFDGRGRLEIVGKKTLRVGFRMCRGVPQKLHREFGGTCFSNSGKWWFRVQGEKARFLLMEILPFLQATKKGVETALRKTDAE